MKLRRWIATVLISLLVVMMGRPLPALAADATFQVTSLTEQQGQTSTQIQRAPISRLAESIAIIFSVVPQQPPQPGWITVRDSHGNDPGWTLAPTDSGMSYSLLTGATVNSPLPPGETYQITVKGGADGVTSATGEQLASDYTVIITTEGTDWKITDVVAQNAANGQTVLSDGAVLADSTTALLLQTSSPLDSATLAGNVVLTDAQGADLAWQPTLTDKGILFASGTPLQPNATYTVTVKGGETGVKTILGDPLPKEFSLSFTNQGETFGLKTAHTTIQVGAEYPLTSTIQRDTYNLIFYMDRPIDCTTATKNVAVTNGQGIDDGTWAITCNSDAIRLTTHAKPGAITLALPRNETYTVTIKGGVDGLKSADGLAMAADLVKTVTTEDKPLAIHYEKGSPYPGAATAQHESFLLHADAGPFTVQVDPISRANPIHVIVRDWESGAVLLNDWLASDYPISRTVNLDRSGQYELVIGPATIQQLWVTANELDLSLEMPLVNLPAMAPFATKNAPFTVNATLADPTKASIFWLYLNDQKLQTLTPSAGNGQITATIDPTKLADGIYDLAAVADGAGNENESWISRSFLVDRVSTYKDVDSTHWARSYIEVMSDLKILAGSGDGLFNPGKPVRRAEFAKMLAATLGLEPTGTNPKPFADMKGDWSDPYLQAVYQAGLMKGEVVNGQRNFYPDRTISRAEAAVTIARALGVDSADLTGYVSPFHDWTAVPTWARSAVAVLSEEKWINGLPDGTFGPLNSLNRDQSAKILANFLGMH